MNAEEYEKLARAEREHWFYRGKRRIVRNWINKMRPPSPTDLLIDCGAGSGFFAEEMAAHCRVQVLDDHAESLSLLRSRFSGSQVVESACTNIPLPDASFEYVTALDVIEHIDDDLSAVKEMLRILKPDGLLIITVPALMSLWSDWDEVLHHKRRYDRASLRHVLAEAGAKICELGYINTAALPAVWTVRKMRKIFPAQSSRMEDNVPAAAVNRLLEELFVLPATHALQLCPAGVGLLAVCRKG